MLILAVNAGSSSIKCAVYDVGGPTPATRCGGQVEGVGTRLELTMRDRSGAVTDRCSPATTDASHEAALRVLLEAVFRQVDRAHLVAVSHRVVHGGPDFSGPVRIDDEIVARIEALAPLAPLHQPHNLRGIQVIGDLLPGLPQVACFDTAFHRTLPEVATTLALPRDVTSAELRRYGFHGLSYASIAAKLSAQAPEVAAGRVIAAHLGSGASLCAMREGRSVETTMSFTPLDGLPMGTRCGAIDPGVVLYLLRKPGMTVDAVEDLLYRGSGLLGLSGISNDMRTLLESDDAQAAAAVDFYVYRIAQSIGSLAASLRGVDALVFTAGIGERSAVIRARVCEASSWLGIDIDPAANHAGAGVISTNRSRVHVMVIPTDEEDVIIRQTMAVLGLGAGATGEPSP